jgi:hypothetical protein
MDSGNRLPAGYEEWSNEERRVEIKLTDNSKFQLKWIRPDALAIELHRPLHCRDENGFMVVGSALLTGDELTALLSELDSTQNTQKVRL